MEELKEESFMEEIISGEFALLDDENDLRHVKFDCCSRKSDVNLHISNEAVIVMMSALGLRKGFDKILKERINRM